MVSTLDWIRGAQVTRLLTGHTSAETAYVVDDYPYGYTLRCKIRYWLEVQPKRGVRFVSQTTNPKRPGEVWNKPKASTYARFGGCLYLDEKGHVQWAGVSEYGDAQEVRAWLEKFGAGNVTPELTQRWLASKEAYEAKRAEGASMQVAAVAGMVAFAKKEDNDAIKR